MFTSRMLSGGLWWAWRHLTAAAELMLEKLVNGLSLLSCMARVLCGKELKRSLAIYYARQKVTPPVLPVPLAPTMIAYLGRKAKSYIHTC
jgi:hypothetical protein